MQYLQQLKDYLLQLMGSVSSFFFPNLQWAHLFSFSRWSEWFTPRTSLTLGLIPSLSTLAIFVLQAFVFTSAAILWASFTGAALTWTAGVSVVLPSIVGLALFNHWFSRDIMTATLASKNVSSMSVYDVHDQPIYLRNMVEHITAEVNMYFKEVYGDAHVDMHVPRIRTFSKDHFALLVAEGRNPGKSGIFIADGNLKSHETRMVQRHLAALIQKELVKIYMRRGFQRTVVGILADFANTYSALEHGNVFSKTLFYTLFPLKVAVLFNNMVQRSYEFEAALIVNKMGNGYNLYQALGRLVTSSQDVSPTHRESQQENLENALEPFEATSWLGRLYKPFADWVDKNQVAREDNSGYRIINFFDIVMREMLYLVNETLSPKPRSTRIKDALRKVITDEQGNLLESARTEDLPSFFSAQESVNRRLWERGLAAEDAAYRQHLDAGHRLRRLPFVPILRKEGTVDTLPRLASFQYAAILPEPHTRETIHAFKPLSADIHAPLPHYAPHHDGHGHGHGHAHAHAHGQSPAASPVPPPTQSQIPSPTL